MKSSLPKGLYQLQNHWPFARQLPGCQLCQLSFDAQQVDAASFASVDLAEPAGINKRRAEFLAGRYAARLALQAIGLPDQYPARLPDSRQPHWPQGSCGSISHSHGRAAAIAASSTDWLGLGLDLEMQISAPRAQRLAGSVLLPAEQEALTADGTPLASAMLLAFSAKESLFKALNPLTGVYFGFKDAQLLDSTAGTLQLRLLRDLGSGFNAGDCLQGQWCAVDGGVLTLVAVPRKT